MSQVILYHETKFGRTERNLQSTVRANAARERLGRWLAAPGAPAGLVLTRPASVARATGRAGAGGPAWPVEDGDDVVGDDPRTAGTCLRQFHIACLRHDHVT